MGTNNEVPEAAKRWKGEKLWLGVLMAGMVLGALAFGYISLFGHTHEFRIPWEPAWGLLVTTFEFFILCGAGLATVAGCTFLVSGERFQGLCMRMTTMSALGFVIGLGLVAIELTQPTRLSLASVLGPDFYRALLLDLFWFVLALIALFFLLNQLRRKNARTAIALGWAIFFLTLAGIFNLGEVFRQFGHPPEWLSPPAFVEYLLAALVSGTALGALILFLNRKFNGAPSASYDRSLLKSLRRWLVAFLAIYGVYLAIALGDGAAGALPQQHPMVQFLFTGPLAFNFWALQIVVGLLLPLFFLRGSETARFGRVALASGMILAGQFFRSYDMIIAKQLETFHAESSFLVRQGLLAMTPCLPKTSVVIGAICLFLFMMTLSEKLVPWEESLQD